jgi:hypothetical protein
MIVLITDIHPRRFAVWNTCIITCTIILRAYILQTHSFNYLSVYYFSRLYVQKKLLFTLRVQLLSTNCLSL